MSVYWINTKDKGLSGEEITQLEQITDIPDCSLSSYDIVHRAVHIVVFDGHSIDELPKLPHGLTYNDRPGA